MAEASALSSAPNTTSRVTFFSRAHRPTEFRDSSLFEIRNGVQFCATSSARKFNTAFLLPQIRDRTRSFAPGRLAARHHPPATSVPEKTFASIHGLAQLDLDALARETAELGLGAQRTVHARRTDFRAACRSTFSTSYTRDSWRDTCSQSSMRTPPIRSIVTRKGPGRRARRRRVRRPCRPEPLRSMRINQPYTQRPAVILPNARPLPHFT